MVIDTIPIIKLKIFGIKITYAIKDGNLKLMAGIQEKNLGQMVSMLHQLYRDQYEGSASFFGLAILK